MNGGWTLILGHQARRDLAEFPWDRDVEVGGVCMGRFETSGINRRDDGKHLFVRRIFASDYGGDDSSVQIDFDAVASRQTIPVRARPRSSGGRWGSDDPGLTIGSVHSHVGLDQCRELSGTDIRTAAANSRGAPPALQGRPFLSVIATCGLRWEAGEPEEDWESPTIDHYLVFGDKTIIKPRVYVQSAIEWNVEEKQRELLAHGGAYASGPPTTK